MCIRDSMVTRASLPRVEMVESKLMEESFMFCILITWIPVSYTHLDVYKRQAYAHGTQHLMSRKDHEVRI